MTNWNNQDIIKIITEYNDGKSLNFIAHEFRTYPTTIARLLQKNNVKLRHDVVKKGRPYVKNGDKLIEWAKAQRRLVTKAELAAVAGIKKLTPSYFVKYPELGRYVVTRGYNESKELNEKLYDWLKKNNILYKPDDRTKLGVSVSVLLLGEYSNIALQISEKATYVSKKKHEDNIKLKSDRAEKVGLKIIFLNKEQFKNLDEIKLLLDSLKN